VGPWKGITDSNPQPTHGSRNYNINPQPLSHPGYSPREASLLPTFSQRCKTHRYHSAHSLSHPWENRISLRLITYKLHRENRALSAPRYQPYTHQGGHTQGVRALYTPGRVYPGCERVLYTPGRVYPGCERGIYTPGRVYPGCEREVYTPGGVYPGCERVYTP